MLDLVPQALVGREKKVQKRIKNVVCHKKLQFVVWVALPHTNDQEDFL